MSKRAEFENLLKAAIRADKYANRDAAFAAVMREWDALESRYRNMCAMEADGKRALNDSFVREGAFRAGVGLAGQKIAELKAEIVCLNAQVIEAEWGRE